MQNLPFGHPAEPRPEVQHFTFAPGLTVRTLLLHAEPWFIASDVAHALGYRNAPDMVRLLDADEAATHNLRIRSSNGTEQQRRVAVISESGMYAAVLRSGKPEAKAFRKWVTGTVLPSIRQHGMYARGAEQLPQATQSALYGQFRSILSEALRRHDRLTQHDHWKPSAKRQAMSQSATAQLAGEMGLPMSVVEATVTHGVDRGLAVVGSLTG